jgi:hypothetical protein
MPEGHGRGAGRGWNGWGRGTVAQERPGPTISPPPVSCDTPETGGPVACPPAPARGYSAVPGRATVLGRCGLVERPLHTRPGVFTHSPTTLGRERRRVRLRVRRRASEAERRRKAVERRAVSRAWLTSAALWVGLAAGGGVLLYLLFRLVG